MGGLIGLGLAALPGSPVRGWCSTTSARRSRPAALQRIGAYLGQPVRWASAGRGGRLRCWAISQGFGPHTPRAVAGADAAACSSPTATASSRTTTRRSPCRSAPSRPRSAAAGEALLWQSYDALRCPTLLLRGAESDLLSRDTAQAMTQRGPKARAARVRRRRPCADAGARRSRSPSCGSSCCATMKTGLLDAARARGADRAAGRRAPGGRADAEADAAQLARARAFAEPLLAGPAARHRRGRAGPCRRRGRDPAGHRRGAVDARGGLPRLRRRLPAASPRRWWRKAFGDVVRQPGRRTRASWCRSSVPRARRRSATSSAPSRPSACARCCWPSRATCAWCCCAWPRGCRRCAGTRPASSRARARWRASRCRCSRRWPTGWASGRSSGRSRTWRSASWSPTHYQRVARAARREARRARAAASRRSAQRAGRRPGARTA